MDKEIKMPMNLVNEVLSYLSKKPYLETVQLINAIADVVGVETKANAETKPKPKDKDKDK